MSRRALVVAAWLDLALLLALVAAYRYIGERWALLIALAYLPQALLLLPSLLLAPLLWHARARLLLGTQALAVALVLLGPMGLRLGGARAPHDRARVLRVMTYNVWYGWGDVDAVARTIVDAQADVVLLQAVQGPIEPALRARLPDWRFAGSRQLLVAARFPLRDLRVRDQPRARGLPPAHLTCTVLLPSGPLDVVVLHPYSPRDGLDGLRGRRRGAFAELLRNAEQRRQQLDAAVAEASRSRHPVLLAGDTNLALATWQYRRSLGAYRDAWDEVGRGFGYTFPSQWGWPWLRLDRVLAGPGVRLLRAGVAPGAGSDHYALVVELELT